jgi:hypothetical protein
VPKGLFEALHLQSAVVFADLYEEEQIFLDESQDELLLTHIGDVVVVVKQPLQTHEREAQQTDLGGLALRWKKQLENELVPLGVGFVQQGRIVGSREIQNIEDAFEDAEQQSILPLVLCHLGLLLKLEVVVAPEDEVLEDASVTVGEDVLHLLLVVLLTLEFLSPHLLVETVDQLLTDQQEHDVVQFGYFS